MGVFVEALEALMNGDNPEADGEVTTGGVDSLPSIEGLRFFFVAIKHSESEPLWESLKKYTTEDARILMAWERANGVHEDTSGEHFHIAIDMDDKQYDSFKKTIILKRYNLRGRVKDGKGKQYGCVNPAKIRSEWKLMCYTVKDKQFRSQNIDIKILQRMVDQSYPKLDSKSDEELLMIHLQNEQPELGAEWCAKVGEVCPELIEKEIISYYIDNDRAIGKSQLKTLTSRYMMKHMKNRINHKNEIYQYIKFQ